MAAWHTGDPPPLVVPPLPASTETLPPPRFLVLYGSLRARSYSRLLAEEGARVLEGLGATVDWFHPHELPVYGAAPDDHPAVVALRAAALASDGMVWSSPEQHGAITAVMKNQLDWLPLSMGALRPTQGRTLAVMQVCGGSQSFNTVNTLRLLGRWLRMITIPNQSSVPKAWAEFHEDGRMKDSEYRDRLVDVMEELYRFTLLTRPVREVLVDRYSERREAAAKAAAKAAASADRPADRIGRQGL